MAALITIKIDDNNGGLKCGPCTLINDMSTPETKDDDDKAKEESKEEIQPYNDRKIEFCELFSIFLLYMSNQI